MIRNTTIMKDAILAEKQRLQEQLAKHTAELQNQKQEFSKNIESYKQTITEKLRVSGEVLEKGKLAALALGAAWLIFQLGSFIFGGSSSPVSEDEEGNKIIIIQQKESGIIKSIKSAIASFLISVAKKELTRVLEKLKEQRQETEE